MRSPKIFVAPWLVSDVLHCAAVREKVLRLYGRIAEFEKSVGFDLVDPVPLVPPM